MRKIKLTILSIHSFIVMSFAHSTSFPAPSKSSRVLILWPDNYCFYVHTGFAGRRPPTCGNDLFASHSEILSGKKTKFTGGFALTILVPGYYDINSFHIGEPVYFISAIYQERFSFVLSILALLITVTIGAFLREEVKRSKLSAPVDRNGA